MRHILIEGARKKQSQKHGGGIERLDLDQVDVAIDTDHETLIQVNDALENLTAEDAQAAESVKLRFFVGLKHQEIAEILGISERSVKRLWSFARAWLYRDIKR